MEDACRAEAGWVCVFGSRVGVRAASWPSGKYCVATDPGAGPVPLFCCPSPPF